MENIILWKYFILLLSGSVFTSETVNQQYVNDIARDLKISWTVESNTEYFNKNKVYVTMINNGSRTLINKDWEIFFDTPMMVEPGILPDKEAVLADQGIKLRHWKGTQYAIAPTPDFIELKPGMERKIKFHLAYWTVSKTDSFPNWYFYINNFIPAVIASTMGESLSYVSNFDSVAQWKRATTDKLNPFTAPERYRRYQNEYTLPDSGKHISIIPKPLYTDTSSTDSVEIDLSWKIYATPELNSEANFLKKKSNLILVVNPPAEKVINLRIGNVIHPVTSKTLTNDEAYHLVINASLKIVSITANTNIGVFYGIQSFLASYSKQNTVVTTTIVDQPRFPYRGMHIDVGRNFHSKASILKLLDVMAMVKLNKLHFHLSDDEGWRLEITGLPELTQIGAQRCFNTSQCLLPQLGSGPSTDTSGSGHYTTSDYQEILRYAKVRHIQVIPEFDMPGHARAAIKSMENRYETFLKGGRTSEAEEYMLSDPDDTSKYWSVQFFDDNAVSPCMNSTYKFLSHVIDEVTKLHKDIQPLTLYHFGGDEVGKGAWVNSSKCQAISNGNVVSSDDVKALFFQRVAELTGKKGLHLAAWEDGMMENGKPFNNTGLTTKDMYAYIWNNIWEWGGAGNAYKMANAGYKVIMCQATHVYFDHPYEPDPEERGYYWAPRFTNSKKTFSFMPDDVYNNIDFSRFGEPLTKADVCKDVEVCPLLTKPENILGMQGHLWSETVRTADELDYMIFPRLLAIGERAWHKADWESIVDKAERDLQMNMDWARYSKAVGLRELSRLEKMGIQYRISPPGAKVEDGKLMTNSEYAGQQVLHSIDDGATWLISTGDSIVNNKKQILLKSMNQEGTRESRVITMQKVEPLPIVDQSVIDYISDHMEIKYEVLNNFDGGVNTYLAEYTLKNVGKRTIPLGNWEIYFYSIYMVEPNNLKGHVPYELPGYNVILQHVNGGFFKMTPTPSFGDFKAGSARKFQIRVRYWSVSRSDVMPNLIVTADGMTSKTIKSTAGESLSFVSDFNRRNQWKRYNEKNFKDEFDPFTPNHRYTINEKVKDFMHPPNTIVPTPLEITIDSAQSMSLSEIGWKIISDPRFTNEASFLQGGMMEQGLPEAEITSIKPSLKSISIIFADPQVTINGKTSVSLEAYSLNMIPASKSIEIKALGAEGAFYGVQSLLSLIKRSENGMVSNTVIKDAPRFPYRGMHLDVGRNFHSNTSVLKLLDVMAAYKLNKFHFHLSDDEGWRLEIPGLDELTKIGSNRCFDLSETRCILPQLGSGPDASTSGSGFYTVGDYKEILAFAATRHIEVIPEFDMPGHAHAAIKAMDARSERLKDIGDLDNANKYLLHDPNDTSKYTSIQLFHDNAINPCIDTTYNFVHHIAKEVSMLHKDINPLKIFHFGGDEVAEGAWLNSPACKNLNESVAESVAALKEIFTRRISNLTNDLGLMLAGWEDGLKKEGNIPFDISTLENKEVYGYAWSNVWEWGAAPRAHIWANAGYKVVMAPATNYYFDHPYEPDPEERGFYWATRYTDTKKVFSFMPENLYENAEMQVSGAKITKADFCGENNKLCPELKKPENLVGIQGNLWSETIRTPAELDYMIFPRLLALAERAWHKAEWEYIDDKSTRDKKRDMDWEVFSNLLGYVEVMYLDEKNVSYRVPPPGAKIYGNKLFANTEIPGLKIMMSFNGGTKWNQIDSNGVEVKNSQNIKLFTWSADEQRKSREISLTINGIQTSTASSIYISASILTFFILLFRILV